MRGKFVKMSLWDDFTLGLTLFKDNCKFAIENTIERGKDFADDLKEIGEDFKQLGRDLDDIVSTGGECASDIVEEANGIIKEANQEYEKKYKTVNDNLQKLSEKQGKMEQKKNELAQNIGCDYLKQDISKEVKNIELKEAHKQTYKQIPKLFGLSTYGASMVALGKGINVFPVGIAINGLMKFKAARERVESAKSYKEKAKDYSVEIANEIMKLNNMNKHIKKVEATLKLEEKVFQILETSFANQRSEEQEKIKKNMEILLIETVMKSDGTINEKYKTSIDELNSLLGSM